MGYSPYKIYLCPPWMWMLEEVCMNVDGERHIQSNCWASTKLPRVQVCPGLFSSSLKSSVHWMFFDFACFLWAACCQILETPAKRSILAAPLLWSQNFLIESSIPWLPKVWDILGYFSASYCRLRGTCRLWGAAIQTNNLDTLHSPYVSTPQNAR